MNTYLIKRSDVEKALTMKDCVEAVEKAFRLYGEEKVQMPPKAYLYFTEFSGDLRCMPAYIPELNAAGIKSVNVHPDNRKVGLPTVMATILLNDPKTGYPVAILDGTHITNMRTGAAGGVAAKYLAKENCKKASFVGAGRQAETQLHAMMVTKPMITNVSVVDLDNERAEAFAGLCSERYNLNAVVVDSIHDACVDADIINCTTASRKPIVMAGDVPPGAHINAIGADAEGKQELDGDVLKKARVVIDDWVQASHSGEINVMVHKGEFRRKDLAAELGKVVAGNLKIRTSDTDITIFDSTGLAIQDLITAAHVYKLLVEGPGKADLQTVRIVD
ncbi:MAG: ornithine cyclodeaminase family protein [Candidatus Zixiibacteriota bacterium]|nr:MAG: ornithine cyclodeaminase family protein [candidate division Zixibacteria bacterium]